MFAATSRLVLGSSPPPVQFVPGALCQMMVVRQPKREDDRSPSSRDSLAAKFISDAVWVTPGFHFIIQTLTRKGKSVRKIPTGFYNKGHNLSTHMLRLSGIEPCTLRRSLLDVRRHSFNSRMCSLTSTSQQILNFMIRIRDRLTLHWHME